MQGWVELCYVKMDQLGIEPATCQSEVQQPHCSATIQHRTCPWCFTLLFVHLYCDILFRSIISHVCCLILVKYQYFEDVLPIQRKQSGLNYKQAKPKPVGTAHMYNVSQEVSHYTLARSFVEWWPIFTNLSPADSIVNSQQCSITP